MHARPDPLTFVGSVGYGLSPDPSYIILRRARKTNMYLLNEAGFGQPLRLPPKVWENKLIDDEINHGTSVKDLTNKVFWLRHPELRGCRLQASCRDLKQLQQEWMRIHAKVSTSKEWRDRLKNLPDFKRFGLGLGQPPPAPDSPVANVFVQAHRSRWCVPGTGPPGSTCRTLNAPRPIRRVVIHTLTSANRGDCIRFGTVNDVVRAWQNPGEASSHYLVDRNGNITQMVREANVAFHATAANPDSIGIEHADICNEPAPYTTQLYERSAALVGEIAARNGFPIRVFGIDTNNRNDATVIGHQILDPANRDDPGPYWDWEYYASLLRWDTTHWHSSHSPRGYHPATPVAPVPVAPVPVAPQGWQLRSRVRPSEAELHPQRVLCEQESFLCRQLLAGGA